MSHRTLSCPRDGKVMDRVSVKGSPDEAIEIDRCSVCGSMWFDALELDRVLATKSGSKSIDLGHGGGRAMPFHEGRPQCPVDHSTLIEMSDLKQGHVRMDACTVCGGILLDPGELADLASFTLKERLAEIIHRIRR